MQTLLDTNAALRYVLDDIPEQADVVEDAIERGAEITLEVFAECVYVLESVYKVSRKGIADALTTLLHDVFCERSRVAAQSLKYYSSSTNLAYVDCVLAAEANLNGRDVLTFDKKLESFIARMS